MTPMYQADWLGIRFRDVAPVSATTLADGAFYDAFYEKFFARYRHWDELGAEWLHGKKAVATMIAGIALEEGRPPRSVLSVGCGNGCVEHFLLQANPSVVLDVVDASEHALRWIRRELDPRHLFVGTFPECLPADRTYDLIFVSAFDYSLTTKEFVAFIRAARSRLADGGALLVISMSLDTPRDLLRRLARYARAALVRILDTFGMNRAWQFWGWYRSEADYLVAMRAGGFSALTGGAVPGGDVAGKPSFFVLGWRR
jgi:SAM-dependent methyltransferase